MESFTALRVHEVDGKYNAAIEEVTEEVLPPGDVTIRVHYSSLNYKDMLAIQGAKGVAASYPHTPGIDCAGVVLASSKSEFTVGDEVLVTGYQLGMSVPGGLGQLVRVPAEWVLQKPGHFSLYETMAYGTAGLTAALCVDSLTQVGITPEFGDVLVTGATGAVGSLSLLLLNKLGFRTVALKGKTDAEAYLKSLGVTEIVPRESLVEPTSKGLLTERWGAAIDTVGGEILMNVLKSIRYGGSVACCGLAAAPTFAGSVFPFILRGINLLGVDSAQLENEIRQLMWNSLAGEWRLPHLQNIVTRVPLSEILTYVDRLSAGQVMGRIVVDLNA
ncbi:MAG: YhdH/YhfP family quinone oxidoreductase [Gammaproteobacteria bacterium]